MPLETATYISDLVATNPLGSDLASTADDHCRVIKSTLKNTFPNIDGEVSVTDTELNFSSSLSANIQDQLNAKVHLGANATLSASVIFPLPTTFTGSASFAESVQIGKSASGANVDAFVRNTNNASGTANARLVAQVGGTSGGDPLLVLDVSGGNSGSIGVDNSDSDKIKIARGTALDNPAITIDTSGVVRYLTDSSEREIGFRGSEQVSVAAGNSFTAAHRGRAVAASSAGNFTVDNSIFSTGDTITFINTTGSNCTLVQGSGVTLRLAGASGTTGNRTVADYGIATIYAQTASVFLVGGPGVS